MRLLFHSIYILFVLQSASHCFNVTDFAVKSYPFYSRPFQRSGRQSLRVDDAGCWKNLCLLSHERCRPWWMRRWRLDTSDEDRRLEGTMLGCEHSLFSFPCSRVYFPLIRSFCVSFGKLRKEGHPAAWSIGGWMVERGMADGRGRIFRVLWGGTRSRILDLGKMRRGRIAYHRKHRTSPIIKFQSVSYFWAFGVIFSNSQWSLGTKSINGTRTILEIKVTKYWPLIFVMDWNLGR